MLESKRLRLEADIAGITVAVAAPEAWIRGPFGDRYRNFPARGPARAKVSVELIEHGEACAAERWPAGRAVQASAARGEAPEYPVALGWADGRLSVDGLFLNGWLDLAQATGQATACSRDAVGSVENFFRVAVSHLLLPEGGFLLHAAAVVARGGGAVVCFGESGAGKSTIASLAGAREVISDDLVALRRDAGGRLVVVPAPFRPGGAPARPEGHLVRGLFHLRQAKTFAITPLGRAAGAASLVGQIPFVLDRAETAVQALALAEAAAADPGVAELAFSPVAAVWDEIEARL